MRVDYASEDNTGVISQLATIDRLQGWASPRCSSAPASSASVPGAWP
jgi:hypothetical protein